MSRRDVIVKNSVSKLPTFQNRFITDFGSSILNMGGNISDQTVFDPPAAAWDVFCPLRFARKLANMALARAGKSRCIRSIR